MGYSVAFFVLCFGPFFVNTSRDLAVKKTATQSSTYGEYAAGRAVDGFIGSDVGDGHCSHTGEWQHRAWWKVDLGHVYRIQMINITYRNSQTARLKGYSLYVTNNTGMTHDDGSINAQVGRLCYHDNGSGSPAYNQSHQCHVYGQYVVFYNTRQPDYAYVELCEVQVYGCPAGRFGFNCRDTCQCGTGGCNPDTGQCDEPGCQTGWMGLSCSLRCHCTSGGACNRDTGACDNGVCQSGWTGSSCFIGPRDLAHGKPTKQSSTNNNDNSSFGSNKAVDGVITKDVLPHGSCSHTSQVGNNQDAWWQVNLESVKRIQTINIIYRQIYPFRMSGFYLFVSNSSFANIQRPRREDHLCYHDHGPGLPSYIQSLSCPVNGQYVIFYNKRPADYEPLNVMYYLETNAIVELCEVQVIEACERGTFGQDCNQTCHCATTDCNKQSGICGHQGCTDGWKGAACDQACAYGTFGQGCTHACHCATHDCNKQTGACGPQGCADGWKGSSCDTACDTGRFGQGCNKTCHCATPNCNKQTGICGPPGCSAGWKGASCDQACERGTFGQSCSQHCHCTLPDCNKYTGRCIGGCVAGWQGIACNQACDNGTFGQDCNRTCHCATADCNKQNGTCVNPRCTAGWKGAACDQACDLGTFGQSCSQQCHCTKPDCNKQTGRCIGGCAAGWQGIACNHACANVTFGQDCNKTCHCAIPDCNKQTGTCVPPGCTAGWKGHACDQACTNNTFGRNCNLTCHCAVSDCAETDGVCRTLGCANGWRGISCDLHETEALPSEPDSQVGTYAGAGVGAVVLIAVVIVVVIVVLRRGKLQTKENTNTRFDDDLETALSLPPAKPERNSHAVSKMAMPVANDNKIAYINVCDVGNKDEEVVYSNMDIQSGVSIDDIRVMIPKKMENEEEEFKNEFKKLPWGAVHPHKEGAKPSNKSKNRFKTTFPYDHSRVILDKVGNDPDSTYINANYIDSIDASQAYVACQGPKEKTVDDFWRMVWQLNTGKIVMVTNLVEGGNVKCHQYWPDEGEPLTTKHFSITLDRERTYAFYVLREISLTQKKTKQERQVHQFHFTAWPDHGTPDNLELVLFHRRVASYRTHLTGQMVVHCSAGLGRTGTFIGLDVLSKEEKKSGRVDIPRYIRTMRKDRMNMVQTHEQYIAVHELLVEAHDLADSLISSTEYPETLKKILPVGKPTNQTKLRKEFEKLQTIIPKYNPSCYTAGMMKENKDKNRTVSNLAVDMFRAYLRSQARGRTDYINAVMLQSHRSKSGYLMTQFPIEDTVGDFWTMVTDYNCENIVVLGTLTEHWLREESETDQAHEVYVKKKKVVEVIPDVDIADYLVTSKISSVDTVRIFTVKQWTSDYLLPPSDSSLLLLLEQLDSRRRSDNTRPVVVMCRNGCTQSGLFCCVSNARDQMKMDEEVDIFQNARQIQIRRPQALRNIEQYQYCYNFISQYLESTNVYIN